MFSFIKELSPQEKAERVRIEKLYDFYGIFIDEWDEQSRHSESTQVKDINLAIGLIISNKPIPKDLHDRLLYYKRQKELKDNKKK